MKHTLKAQSVLILRQIISLPGAATTIDEIYMGGRLLAVVLPTIVPTNVEAEMDRPKEIELTLNERTFCKKAFEFALSKQALPASEYANDILESLEFVTKPTPPPAP